MEKNELIGMSAEGMRDAMAAIGEPGYRGRQLFHALYKERLRSFGEITTFSARLRKRLENGFRATLPVVVKTFRGGDGTARYLLRLDDGKEIETVLMPERERDTICVSTQAGCAVDCKFCLTGVMGFQRNLSPGEIVGQVLLIEQAGGRAKPRGRGKNLGNQSGDNSGDDSVNFSGNDSVINSVNDSGDAPGARQLNLVFMGMGEPLLNYTNVMEAVKLLSDPEGIGILPRHMTLSTSGIVPAMRQFGSEPVRPKLAISLNATTDEVRDRIMPINRKWPIAELLGACREFPLRPRERLTFEYVLLEGVNDSAEDAKRLDGLLRGLRAKVNLIGLNPGPGLPFSTPPDSRVVEFQQDVIRGGVPAYIRKPRGRDIFAACGQLKLTGAASGEP